jgi:hypothetical protein
MAGEAFASVVDNIVLVQLDFLALCICTSSIVHLMASEIYLFQEFNNT